MAWRFGRSQGIARDTFMPEYQNETIMAGKHRAQRPTIADAAI